MKKKLLLIIVWLTAGFAFAQETKDTIYKIDRSVIHVRIDIISEFEVIYRESLSPEIQKSLRLSAIWKIIYSNGFEEFFNEPLPEEVVVPTGTPIDITENSVEQKNNDIDGELPEPTYTDESSQLENKKNKLFENFNIYVDNRPILAIRAGIYAPIIFHDNEWVTFDPNSGLGLRMGYAAEFGVDFNFHQLFGLSLVSGFTNHQSSLDFLDDGTNTLLNQSVKLTTIPTRLQMRFYPFDGFSIIGGLVFNSLSLSDTQPRIEGSSGTGYTFGLSRLSPMGRNKNLFEISMNYTNVGLKNPYIYSFDPIFDGTTSFGEFTLDKLGYVDIKFSFLFDVLKKK